MKQQEKKQPSAKKKGKRYSFPVRNLLRPVLTSDLRNTGLQSRKRGIMSRCGDPAVSPPISMTWHSG